jgi:6-phosphogluconolactonase
MSLSLKAVRALALAASALAALGAAPLAAKTFVYVSAAQDGVIDAYAMEMSNGALTPIGKVEAG